MISLDQLLAQNVLPDAVVRLGIRRLLAEKLRFERRGGVEARHARLMEFVEELKRSPIAVKTEAANAQHYEMPTEFFKHVLGPRMKYSSGYWRSPRSTLDESEEAMLELTCERAAIEDGMEVLELGCGWGSLTLWMAEAYPNARITAVSNSVTQREFVEAECRRRGFTRVSVVTADMRGFDASGEFDRVVSVEMFEHMKNYHELMRRIAAWLRPDGRLFVHVFTHRDFAYHFTGADPSDWITRYFFEGGTMPSDSLLLYFQDELKIERHWRVSGAHYRRTAEAWLANFDRHRSAIVPILAATYGEDEAPKWRAYWRVFFMACAELWGWRGGDEWIVSHYRFRK